MELLPAFKICDKPDPPDEACSVFDCYRTLDPIVKPQTAAIASQVSICVVSKVPFLSWLGWFAAPKKSLLKICVRYSEPAKP